MGIQGAYAKFGADETGFGTGHVSLWEYDHNEDAQIEIGLPGERTMVFRLTIREARELLPALEHVLAAAP